MQNYKPVLLLGNGIRNNPALIEHLCSLNIPILLTWMACDLLPEDSPVFCGRPGIFGQRAANIIQQKATHLFCFGARLDGEQVAYDYDNFAPNAKKFIYDIDRGELMKFGQLRGDVVCSSDLDYAINVCPLDNPPDWLAWCKALYIRFRPELDGLDDPNFHPIEYVPIFVNLFTFTRLLHEHSKADDVFAIGSSGNAPCTFYQSYKVKQGQRISNVSTIGAMGADIPMAMGAAMATGRRTICVTGDGGFQVNAQELETIRRLQLPNIFFVMNNNGYNSIRVAQKARFGRVTGADPASGLTLPAIEAIAEAYRIVYMKLDGSNLHEFERCLGFAPMIVEVMINPDWEQLPRVKAFGNPPVIDAIERMSPYLDDDELARIMAE